MPVFKFLSRLTAKLFVRFTVQGKPYLKANPNRLFILESDRESHRYLLLKALTEQGNRIQPQQLFSAAHSGREDLLNRLELQAEKLDLLDETHDIEVVPVSIYHGRMPQRETSLINLMYAETWDKAGFIGRFMQLLVNGRQTLIQADQPLSFRQLQTESPNQTTAVIARISARIFDAHFYRRRLAVAGPDLSHRRNLISLILQDQAVKDQIHDTANNKKQTVEQTRQEARKILLGMAADFSPTMARALVPALGLFWKRIYKDVHVVGVEKAQACAPDHQLVYLPCHRSHMDYVMLSWNLYRHGLMIPHIAAGDNLNAPLLGSILKRGGAFFMRRSFKGDPLYSQLFKSYMSHMSNRGHSLEYFIEGGRSRTGRLLPAKPGLLGMTLEGFIQRPEKPIALVPVWISYDKLVESQSYQKELAGKKKKRESFLGLLKTLHVFRNRFGDAALSFGDPIYLQEALDTSQDLRTLTSATGFNVIQQINKAVYVNQTALIAAVMLAKHQTYSVENVSRCVTSLADFLSSLPNAPAGIATGQPEDWIQLAIQRNQITESEGQLSLNDSQAMEMTFYRNQLHHLLVLPGLYLLLTKRYANPLPQTLPRLIQVIYPFLRQEFFLPWNEPDAITGALRQIRLKLEESGQIIRDEKKLKVCEEELTLILMRTAEPVLLRYYIMFRLISENESMAHEDLITESQRIADQLHLTFGFRSPEYSDKITLQLFLDAMLDQHVLVETDTMIRCTIDSQPMLKRAKQILNPNYVELIEANLLPR